MKDSRYFNLGLLGWPVEHSLSPVIHQAALEAVGLSGQYRLFAIPPTSDRSVKLKDILEQMRCGNLHGLNVTIPHKQTVIPLLDDLTSTARAIGAVNVISLQEGRLIGDNTDAPGFLADLERSMNGGYSGQSRAIVLGAGGAARAVVYALLGAGWKVCVASRRPKQAQELTKELCAISGKPGSSVAAISLTPSSLKSYLSDCDLVVNATPLGMSPHVDAIPWPQQIPLPAGVFIYDLVYNPPETALVRLARSAGLAATTGLGMLVEQAALAFEQWTGLDAPRSAMRAALTAFVQQRDDQSITQHGG